MSDGAPQQQGREQLLAAAAGSLLEDGLGRGEGRLQAEEASGGTPRGLRRLRRMLEQWDEEAAGSLGGHVPMAEVTVDDDDPQHVSEYLVDIYGRLGRDEASLEMPQPDYLEAQPELSARARAVAVDWAVEVQMKFKLRTETLFLTVSLLDRFLALKRVKRKDLQLVVVSAMFIAAKFEEIDPPDVRDFVFITKQACGKEAILAMEVTMLTALEFCLCRPTAAHFLERYQCAGHCNETHCFLVQYVLEIGLADLQIARFSASQQAAAAIYVGSWLLRERPVWPATLARHVGGSEREVRQCALQVCRLLEAAPSSPLQAVHRKFLKPEHHGVAKLTL